MIECGYILSKEAITLYAFSIIYIHKIVAASIQMLTYQSALLSVYM